VADPLRWLARVHVEGFRSLRDADFAPGQATVLIGPNGAGKSNLLQFLQMMPMVRTRSLGRFVADAGGAANLLHYGGASTREIRCELEFEVAKAGTSRYRATWHGAAGDKLVFGAEEVGFRPLGDKEFQAVSLGSGHLESRVKEVAESDRMVAHLNLCLKGLSFFHFHDTSVTSLLRGSARVEDGMHLRSDGANLAAYLYALHHSDDAADQAAWRRVGLLLRQIAPFVKELQPGPVSTHGTPMVREGAAGGSVRLQWIDDRDGVFGPEHLSDGTLRMLALIAALTQPAERMPRFVSIDEPELGLHPAALQLLVELVRSVAGHTQVLLATQSPALLDLFEAGEVVVCERKDGAATFRRLEREQLADWLKDYSLSQLFDKNVLGGRP
jgi:predicted ATPase